MSRTKSPRLDVDTTRERLEKLGLQHAAEQLTEQLSLAVKETASPHRLIDTLLEIEISQREERRVRTALRLSGLPTGQTLSNFDFGFQPSVDRGRIETLATCAWIRERSTLLLQGPPGVGKTHLVWQSPWESVRSRPASRSPSSDWTSSSPPCAATPTCPRTGSDGRSTTTSRF